MKNLTDSCANLEKMARKHPTRTVLATVGAGIAFGVLIRLLHGRDKHPTRIETAINPVNGIGHRIRNIFR